MKSSLSVLMKHFSKMEGSLADELYSETLQLSRVKLDHGSTTNLKQDELCDSNGDDLWDGSDEDLDKVSDLDREWQRRRDQFHTIGYRDGLIAAKEASAQEGFNVGFKESVFVGYKWGLVRGVTSALACLPDGLKEKLVETEEARNKFQCLYKTVHSLSTDNALKLFHDGILKNKSVEQTGNVESSSNVADMQDRSSDSNVLENRFEELHSLLRESPTVKVHLTIDL
ncbi:hypothetical protein PVL29_027233 [Vitis rotundifolia]|uniref:Essential protein Yae1 N-terminal domain-containing protein n=2 Tax=Vitis rotundifolia TaxID=103349 RepID=A0AA39D6M3_VITRO|nr:hypothetical protein PVL29_027233 [Vitis rotundifolia]